MRKVIQSIKHVNAHCGTRTHDHKVESLVLNQLSYVTLMFVYDSDKFLYSLFCTTLNIGIYHFLLYLF